MIRLRRHAQRFGITRPARQFTLQKCAARLARVDEGFNVEFQHPAFEIGLQHYRGQIAVQFGFNRRRQACRHDEQPPLDMIEAGRD